MAGLPPDHGQLCRFDQSRKLAYRGSNLQFLGVAGGPGWDAREPLHLGRPHHRVEAARHGGKQHLNVGVGLNHDPAGGGGRVYPPGCLSALPADHGDPHGTSLVRDAGYPSAISPTLTAAMARPAACRPAIRSRRTSPASATVTAGYIEVTTATSPCGWRGGTAGRPRC